jgi:2,5-dihydroxypyridine 5,6-dioxygenase
VGLYSEPFPDSTCDGPSAKLSLNWARTSVSLCLVESEKMRRMELMRRNATKIVRECCNVTSGEGVVILTDSSQSPAISACLFDAVNDCDGIPLVLTINPLQRAGADLPDVAAESLQQAQVIIAPTSKSVFYADAVQRACHGPTRARFVAMSECDEGTLLSGGIDADFGSLQPIVRAVAMLFSEGTHLSMRTPAGTDIVANIGGRIGNPVNSICHEPGQMVGLPDVEVNIAAIEQSINGEIVVDGSCSGGVGLITEEPVRLRVEEGRAREITGAREARQLNEILATSGSASSYQVAELAVGLNPCCNLTGRIIEDEGKYGTCHMALGTNIALGGKNSAPVHIDLVQCRPTVEIDGRLAFVDGQVVLPGFDPSTLVATA